MSSKKKHKRSVPEATPSEEIAAEESVHHEETLEEAYAEKEALRDQNRIKIQRLKAVLGALGLFFGYFFFPQLFYLMFSPFAIEEISAVRILATTIGSFVYFFFLLRYYLKRCKKTGETISEILSFHPRHLSLKPLLLCMLMGVCLNLSFSALLALLPIPEAALNAYAADADALIGTGDPTLSYIYVSIIAPLCEELIFRGFIYYRMTTGFSARVSAIVATLAFALPHINFIWVIIAALNGLLFTAVRVRYDNLSYSIILHIFYNIVSIPMMCLMGTEIYTILFDNVIVELIYLFLGGAVSYFCFRKLMEKPEEAEEIKYEIYSDNKT